LKAKDTDSLKALIDNTRPICPLLGHQAILFVDTIFRG